MRIFLAIAITCLFLTISASPVHAQTNDKVYAKSGPWTVVDAESTCTLHYEDSAQGKLKYYTSTDQNGGLLFEKSKKVVDTAADKLPIKWAFDGKNFKGSSDRGAIKFWTDTSDDRLLSRAFRQARRLTIYHGKDTVAVIPLTGSAKAYRALQKCTAQYGEIKFMQMPDMTREPVPIKPEKWVTPDDYSYHNNDEGTVEFQLLVNERGHVQTCKIIKSSGLTRLDERTCKLISRRARFTPATDSKGSKVAGTYSSSISWKIPE